MIRSLRSFRALSLVWLLLSTEALPLSPVNIKDQLEDTSHKALPLKALVKEVLTSKAVDPFFTTYSVDTILHFKRGTGFMTLLMATAYPNTNRHILATYLKPYTQKILTQLLQGTIPQLPTPTLQQALYDIATLNKIYTDITQGIYQQQAYRVAPLLKTLLQEEHALNKQNYMTFFHSQRWEYLFGEKLFTDLWALTQHKTRPTNYLFAHVRIAGYDPLEKNTFDRTTILLNGRLYEKDPTRDVLLFANNSLFGNYKKRDGGSSLSFFLKNDNRNNTIHLHPEAIFRHYHLEKWYKKYRTELDALQQQFDAAKTLGTILMIAIPKNLVNDYCFATNAGGYKKINVSDTGAFIETLHKKPETKFNNEEFCIIMLDEAMNPEGRITIKAYHCAETTAWQKFETGYEQLVTKLAADINPPTVNKAKIINKIKKK